MPCRHSGDRFNGDPASLAHDNILKLALMETLHSKVLCSAMVRISDKNYSRTSVMWTPKGRTKSVHNSEVSTLVKLGVATGHRLQEFISDFSSAPHIINGRPLRTYHVQVEKLSTGLGCPQQKGVHKEGLYCN